MANQYSNTNTKYSNNKTLPERRRWRNSKRTAFSENDTGLYTALCLFINNEPMDIRMRDKTLMIYYGLA